MRFTIHDNFKLNGISFKKSEALLSFSRSLGREICEFLTIFLDDSELIRLQTSGSTGVPKEIDIRKDFMLNSARATGEFFGLNERTRALLCMNPNFVGGKMMLVRAILLGWELDVVAPSLNPLKGLEESYDFCAMVPLQVYHSLNELNKVRQLIIGGGAVSKDLESSLQKVNTKCFSTYGMTETVSHIALRSLNPAGAIWNQREKSHDSFEILPNISISKDSRGCLVIDAPKVSESLVVTNDVVALISDTEFKWLGRYDNVINSGGVKLHPEQIEEKLSKIIKERFFVTGIPDEVLGQKLVLLIEGSGEVDDILNVVAERSRSKVKNLISLSKFEIPKEVYTIRKFIETETKKIQRKKTLDLLKLY